MSAKNFCSSAWAMCLVMVVLASIASAADKQVTVKLSQEKDGVNVIEGKDQVTIQVDSKTGIGKAEILPVDKKWPSKLVIELNVKALEGHTIRQGDIALQQGGDTFRRVNDEWVRIENLDKALQPTVTNKDGKFFIEIPAAWLKPGSAPLNIEWIDFYRR